MWCVRADQPRIARNTVSRPCQYCGEPVLVSKQNYRDQFLKKNGEWVKLIWHTKCDPFIVKVTVEKR